MNSYTDFYVMPVKTAKLEEYRRFADESRNSWLAHGALSVTEYIADDAKPGVHTSFPQSVKLEGDESIAVAVLTFASREDCARIKAAVMKEPVFAKMGAVPVDGQRMFWGGFKPFVGDAVPLAAPAIQPYLFFRGRCEEAMTFYKETLGARIGLVLRFKDNPDKPPRDKVPAEFDERIMHAEINIAGTDLMMSDGMKSGPLDFQCMSLSLSVVTEAEAGRIFQALAKDGTVQMPLGKAFFSPCFGAVLDKFGVSWMVITQPKA